MTVKWPWMDGIIFLHFDLMLEWKLSEARCAFNFWHPK